MCSSSKNRAMRLPSQSACSLDDARVASGTWRPPTLLRVATRRESNRDSSAVPDGGLGDIDTRIHHYPCVEVVRAQLAGLSAMKAVWRIVRVPEDRRGVRVMLSCLASDQGGRARYPRRRVRAYARKPLRAPAAGTKPQSWHRGSRTASRIRLDEHITPLDGQPTAEGNPPNCRGALRPGRASCEASEKFGTVPVPELIRGTCEPPDKPRSRKVRRGGRPTSRRDSPTRPPPSRPLAYRAPRFATHSAHSSRTRPRARS